MDRGRTRVALCALLVLAGSSAPACYSGRGDDDDDIASPIDCDDPVDVTLRLGVIPGIAARDCATAGLCHDSTPGNPAGGLPLGGGAMTPDDVYGALLIGGDQQSQGLGSVVDTATVTSSLLLSEPLAGSPVPHAGGKQYADDCDPVYRSMRGWIQSGAQND